MNKILIKTLIFVMFIVLSSCSFKPIFIEKEYTFEIEETIFEGEKDINRVIANKLKLIKKNDDPLKKKYFLVVDSKKRIEIVSKDSKGDPVKFEMFIEVNYKLKEDDETIFNKKIEKKNIYNNDSDKFELEENEKIILQNLAEKISDNIVSSIINLNDN